MDSIQQDLQTEIQKEKKIEIYERFNKKRNNKLLLKVLNQHVK